MIAADNVRVTFGRGPFRKPIRALDGFSIGINRGDVFGLVGPNGAGKSTAVYCFLGLIKPDAGRVEVFGEAPDPGAPVYNRIAYLPEEPHYHLYLTVEEAVRYYASLYSSPIPESRIEGAIERMGLVEFKDLRLEKCSKGMKQKAGLAVCLLNEPELVFLDEPTRGLDPVIVREFKDIIVEMNRRGTTFVINSHVLSEVESLCNRVAIMNRGRVVVQSSMEELLRRDAGSYAVDLDVPGDLPVWLSVSAREGGRVKGEVPAGRIGDFFDYLKSSGAVLYECSLKKASLEDTFLEIVGKG